MRQKPLLRVRKTGALLVAAVIAFVGAVPVAGAGWQYAPILLIPAAVFVWAWRAGTDVRKPTSCGSGRWWAAPGCPGRGSPSWPRTGAARSPRCSTTAT